MTDNLVDPQELQRRREEKQVLNTALEALDASLDEIGEDTLNRLADSRRLAVAAAAAGEKRRSPVWVPAAGVAAAVMAVVLFQAQNSPTGLTPALQISEAEQALLLEATQPWDVEPELLDDLAFYTWLALQDEMEETHAG